MGIKESALSVIASLTDSDFIRAVTAAGESRKIQATGVGKYAVETYSGSTLAGSAQSVQSAVGGLKNDITTMQGDIATLNTNLINKLKKSLIVGTASGSIASFNNGSDIFPALKCVAKIEPNQDLHGYDKPWVGGAGKNKIALNLSPASAQAETRVTVTEQTENKLVLASSSGTWANLGLFYTLPAGTYTISLKATASDSFEPLVSIYNSNSTAIAQGAKQGTSKTFTLPSADTINIRFFATDSTFVSRTVTFTEVQIEQGSSPTAWQPYSNICPISGWSGVDVGRCGINLWDEVWELGGFDANGDKDNLTDRIRTKNYIPLKPSTNYFVQFPTGVGFVYFFYDVNKTMCGVGTIFSPAVITTPSNAHYMRFRLGTGYGTTYNNDISINYPSTDHDYHAYNGTTYTVSWSGDAGTVYGGTVDVVSGELTVTHASTDLTDGMSGGTIGASYVYFKQLTPAPKAVADSVPADVIAEGYTKIRYNGIQTVGSVAIRGSNGNIFVNTGSQDITPTGIAVYELDTPITYTLTAQQVDILLGDNIIFANTGPMDPVEYYADATITIQNLS